MDSSLSMLRMIVLRKTICNDTSSELVGFVEWPWIDFVRIRVPGITVPGCPVSLLKLLGRLVVRGSCGCVWLFHHHPDWHGIL